jgi:hypothetical protein
MFPFAKICVLVISMNNKCVMKWRERNSTTSGAKDLELGFDGLHKVSHPILGVGV